MGNTFHEVPPHTDEAFRYSPPGVNVLACVRPADDGGESILVDGFQAAAQLRAADPDAFELLCRYAQDFNRVHPGSLDQRGRQPMIVLDDRGAVIGIRFHTRAAGPLNLPAEVVKPYYAAHRRLCERLFDPSNQLRFQLDAGDAVLFDITGCCTRARLSPIRSVICRFVTLRAKLSTNSCGCWPTAMAILPRPTRYSPPAFSENHQR